MRISQIVRGGSVVLNNSRISGYNRRKSALAVMGAAVALVPLFGGQTAMATMTWDPNMTAGVSPGGNGNWDTTVGNNVWWNGTTDGVYATDTTAFTGALSIVNVDTNVTATGIIFNTSGDTIGGTSTVTVGASGANTGTLTGATETINTPLSAGSATWFIDGTMNLGGSILGNGKPAFGATTTGTATYVFTGDMSQYTGTNILVGGGVTAALNHIVTMVYNSTVVSPTAGVGAGVFGGTTGVLALAYQGDLVVDQPLNIVGEFNLNQGGQQGLGDLSQNGETVSGTAPVNAGFNANNGANTTIANGLTGLSPFAFIASNTGNFLTNNLSAGNALTIGRAGTATAASLSSTNAGRILTIQGSGATVINSTIQDGTKAGQTIAALNYVNSILAYNGSGSLTLSSPGNSYKGATYIEQGTVKLGATNAIPTGQGLAAGITGGTPGLVMFGDTDAAKGAGGVLDLAGFNQTVSGLGIQAGVPVASLSPSFKSAVWTVAAANAAGTSSFLTIAGFAPYNCGLAIGEGITIGAQTGTIISLANNGGSTQSLLVGMSFDPAAGSYSIGAGTVVLAPSSAMASSQIIGNSSILNNSTLTFAGGTHGANTFATGEGVGATSTFGGVIKDSVNGGTMKVALNVSGGTLDLSGINTYTGGTTVNGTSGAVLNVSGLIANNSSSGVSLGDTTTFGTADNLISRAVSNGGTYSGLGATEIGGGGTKIDLVQGSNVSNGSTLDVNMEVRLTNGTDVANLPSVPAEFSSDVLGLTGMVIGGGASGQTDPFALQMSYNPILVNNPDPTSLYLAYTNSAESIPFSNAVNGDFGTGINAMTDVQSSYAAFALANGITDANIGNYLGSWGVDTTGDNAWAIVNHNSQFAVVSVPEPAALTLLALGGVGVLSRRSRKSRSA